MTDGIINKNIRVENIEAKMASTGNMKYILTDSDKNKYFFWQKNKGEDSSVYLAFTGMGVKKGDSLAIGYTEKDESFVNREGKTINYTDRFILGLREANGAPVSKSSSQPQSANGEANRPLKNDSRNWDREAYEKCCSIWAAAVLTNGGEPLHGVRDGAFYELFQAIRQSGYEKFEKKEDSTPVGTTSKSGKAAFERGMARREPPMHAEDAIEQGVIEAQHEGINVEDIPF
jgi:hypothetical protein